MLTPRTRGVPFDFSRQMGLSWNINSEPTLAYAVKMVEKDGVSRVRFCSDLKILMEQKLGVIFIFNTAGAPVHELTTETLKLALLEKTGFAPPGTPEIPDSPVVSNFPVERLQSLDGVFVTGSGYDEIRPREDLHAVEWTLDACAPQSSKTLILYPRESGWFAPLYSASYQQYQFRFPAVSGQESMVRRARRIGPNLEHPRTLKASGPSNTLHPLRFPRHGRIGWDDMY